MKLLFHVVKNMLRAYVCWHNFLALKITVQSGTKKLGIETLAMTKQAIFAFTLIQRRPNFKLGICTHVHL